MSGELVPSQFRYTTTNNRDFVIGDPTNSAELLYDKYIVFQTNTTPGFSTNPYLGVHYNGSSWQLQFSSNGVSSTTFAQSNAANTFTATNNFNGLVYFTDTVSFAVGTSFAGATTFNGIVQANALVTAASGITVSGTGTFNNNVIITGTLNVTGATTVGTLSELVTLGKTVGLNYNGNTTGSPGSGVTVYGTANAIIASILTSTTTTTSDTWTLLPASGHPISFVGDPTYAVTFRGNGLTAARSYTYPNNSGTILLNPGTTYAGGKLLVASTDNTSVTESAILVSNLTGLTSNVQTQISTLAAEVGSFSGSISAVAGTFSGALQAATGLFTATTVSTSTTTGAVVIAGGLGLAGSLYGTLASFSSSVTASSVISTGTIAATAGISGSTGSFGGAVSALSFSGSGAGLTGTATSLSIGGNSATSTSIAGGLSGNVIYQAATGSTGFVSNGLIGNVLTWNGTPVWAAPVHVSSTWLNGTTAGTGSFSFSGATTASNWSSYFTTGSTTITATVACAALVLYQAAISGNSGSGSLTWTVVATILHNGSTVIAETTYTYGASGTSNSEISAVAFKVVPLAIGDTLSFTQTSTNATSYLGQSLSIMVV